MAIPNNYIDKLTDNDNGESRLICPPAEQVRVENENFDSTNLDDVLTEMQRAIDEAASQGGIQRETDPTVPSWAKRPNPPTPQEIGAVPSQGYVPLSQDEKDKLDALPTSSELNTQLGGKADKSTTYTKTETDEAIADAVEGLGGGSVESVSVNGGQPVQPVDGNVNLQGVATEDYVDDAVDEKLTEVTVNAVGNSASMYFAGSALCISTANLITASTSPTITTSQADTTLTITATGATGATISLVVGNDTPVTGTTTASVTINRGDDDASVLVSATAKEDGKAVSAPTEQAITVPKLPASAVPVITTVDNETNVEVGVSAQSVGTLKAYIVENGVETEQTLVNGSFTINKTSIARTVTVKATNKETNKSTSITTEQVAVGSYVDLSKMLMGYCVSANSFKVYLNGDTNGLDAVVNPAARSDGFYDWYVDLSSVIGDATGLSLTNKNGSNIVTVESGGDDFNIKGITKIPDAYSAIGGHAFYCLKSVLEITVPSSVNTLGTRSFGSTTNMQTITFLNPNAPTTLPKTGSNNCFRGCAVTSIKVPRGSKSAYDTAFSALLQDQNKSTDIITEISE